MNKNEAISLLQDAADWADAMLEMAQIASTNARAIVRLLKEQPEIVRCKDCKHLFNGEHTENCCDVLMEKADWQVEIFVNPDWFCADGERAENAR